MSQPIEDYALIGDLNTAALVGRDGSIDWLCLPRFDSGAAFAALLGGPDRGRWLLAPAGETAKVRRRYRGDTLVLETEFETDGGAIRLVDFMPPRTDDPTVVRMVEGIRGRVEMTMELAVKFDYGSITPWIRPAGDAVWMAAGPDAVWFWSDAPTQEHHRRILSRFGVGEGERISFSLRWCPSHRRRAPHRMEAEPAAEQTTSWWHRWVAGCTYQGKWRDAVVRSLVTLKALTYQPTGGIVAAPTTSLPEDIGGVRNWDYRLCWVRDATFTLYALMSAGYRKEASAWRDWLLRAVAGDPEQLQNMYGPAGERRLTELELPWLPGYRNSRPVRVGNAAVDQFQLDVFGELMDAMHQARIHGIEPAESAWDLQRALMETLEAKWDEPDDGIWEMRGPRRHFTHSKVLAWVAADRAVKAVERFGMSGPADRWRELRADIHDQTCRQGYDTEKGAFTQYYGSSQLDASLLMIPLVGFLPATDKRVIGTMEAVQRELCRDGLVMRYLPEGEPVDGLPGTEATFLPCTFWLADNLWMSGRHAEATSLFEDLISIMNDVGLFAEEFDPGTGHHLGNFPQAFTHVSFVNTALNLSGRPGPSHRSHS